MACQIRKQFFTEAAFFLNFEVYNVHMYSQVRFRNKKTPTSRTRKVFFPWLCAVYELRFATILPQMWHLLLVPQCVLKCIGNLMEFSNVFSQTLHWRGSVLNKEVSVRNTKTMCHFKKQSKLVYHIFFVDFDRIFELSEVKFSSRHTEKNRNKSCCLTSVADPRC